MCETLTFNISGDSAPRPRPKRPYTWTRAESPDYRPPAPRRPLLRATSTPTKTTAAHPYTPPAAPSYSPIQSSPEYKITPQSSPKTPDEVTPSGRPPLASPQKRQKGVKKLFTLKLKQRLIDTFKRQRLNERKSIFTNLIYPQNVSMVESINTTITEIGQITRDLSRVNKKAMELMRDSCPQIILAPSIVKTYQISHISPFSRGEAKSAMLDIANDQLTLYEGSTSYPATMGLYLPTVCYSQGPSQIRLSNMLCPYAWMPALKKSHQCCNITNLEVGCYKYQIVEPPQSYPLVPESELCNSWHNLNKEVLTTIPSYSEK